MRAALQIIFAAANAAQPRLDRGDMLFFSGVACTGQRDLALAEIEGIGGPGLDQSKRLERLDGRTGIDRSLQIPRPGNDRPRTIDDGVADTMTAFRHRPPGHLDDNRRRGDAERRQYVVMRRADVVHCWRLRIAFSIIPRNRFSSLATSSFGPANLMKTLPAGLSRTTA